MSSIPYQAALTGNSILDILISSDNSFYNYIDEIIDFEKNQILYDNDELIEYIYFPIDTIIALRCDLESGHAAEFAQIGREGLVGISALMGGTATQNTAIVQTRGRACRISSEIIQKAFDGSALFRRVILQYMQALMKEAAQSVICTRFHSITQQYCRTLLLASDRLGSQTFNLTHEQLAVAIGCRREAVSLAARKLQTSGLIRYAYGQITILDRARLEASSCECYETVKLAFSGFLPAASAS